MHTWVSWISIIWNAHIYSLKRRYLQSMLLLICDANKGFNASTITSTSLTWRSTRLLVILNQKSKTMSSTFLFVWSVYLECWPSDSTGNVTFSCALKPILYKHLVYYITIGDLEGNCQCIFVFYAAVFQMRAIKKCKWFLNTRFCVSFCLYIYIYIYERYHKSLCRMQNPTESLFFKWLKEVWCMQYNLQFTCEYTSHLNMNAKKGHKFILVTVTRLLQQICGSGLFVRESDGLWAQSSPAQSHSTDKRGRLHSFNDQRSRL